MTGKRARSNLHLQMGQETIYLLLAVSLFAAFLLAARVVASEQSEEPPIIVLPEAAGYQFATGSAEISPAFLAKLKTIVAPRVKAIGERYRAQVIEVIGHTDEVPLRRQAARDNLDSVLLSILQGGSTETPVAHDNIGLGMARAVAVAAVLRRAGLGGDFVVVPLSAGPFLRPGDTMAGAGAISSDAERRRIEVRVRRRVTS